MLKLLRINNIALIRDLDLELGPGLNLLTGETGAGKSILIDSLGLLLGARASGEILRTGEDRASVEAIVETAGLAPLLESHGIPVEGDEIVLRREIQASGKGRATINGALVPVAVLRELSPHIAAIHGQHEHQGLSDPGSQLALLDRHAQIDEAETGAMAASFRRLRELELAIAAQRRDRRETERRRETLEFQAAEIERANLEPGEEESLRQEKALQANAERLGSLAREAYALLHEDEAAVLTRLGQAYRKVEELAGIDRRFEPHLEARSSVRAPLEDLAYSLRDYGDRLDLSPGRLDEIEGRLALIERLKRKYGGSVAEVLIFAARCREELLALGSPEEQEQALEARRRAAAAEYLSIARGVGGRRRNAAGELERRVEQELALLAMEKTRFGVSFTPADPRSDAADSSSWAEHGLESVEFVLSPNPGEELRSLARIASGGELSRILLALKSVASADACGKTLVFDEVDSGIGGRVAEVVGRKLKSIAGRHQVLCVTHLPQIASLADRHYRVWKRAAAGRTLTEVHALGPEERIEEVARMLGGETVTEAARRHAREMLRLSADPGNP